MEGKSTDAVSAYWRPAIGWVCVGGLGYEFIVRQVFNGILVALGLPPSFDGIEAEALELLIYVMLGLGTLRTGEKIKGVARD
jgi:hypothetical protein